MVASYGILVVQHTTISPSLVTTIGFFLGILPVLSPRAASRNLPSIEGSACDQDQPSIGIPDYKDWFRRGHLTKFT